MTEESSGKQIEYQRKPIEGKNRKLAKSTHQKLIDQAERDPLTRLLNRRGLASRSNAAIAHADRSSENLAFFITDLDNFKTGVNDAYGHPTGDAVIRYTSECVEGSLRLTDSVARIGGDELAGIIVNPDQNYLGEIEKRIKEKFLSNSDRLRELLPNPAQVDEIMTKIGISIGITSIQDGDSYSDMYQRADSELTKVKIEKGTKR